MELELSCATINNASDLITGLLIVVMELQNVLMAVMRLDVVSYYPGWAYLEHQKMALKVSQYIL